MNTKFTIYLDNPGETSINREDGSVLIEVISDDTLEIFIAPELFGGLRAAMDAAERR